MGTLNMLGLAKRIGARFLLTSTSEVYGDPLEHPQKETYWGHVNPIGVRSCYDEGKRTAETLTMDYHRGDGVEVRIARIFNTYGPRMCLDDGRVVSNFVSQAIRKQPMTVYGDGKQTRSFQYVSDLVDGLVALMESEHIGPFNLGNPGEFTMLELAEVVKETIDSSATIEFKQNTADDPHKRKPDISKAKDLLNWEPKISLREGLPLMNRKNPSKGNDGTKKKKILELEDEKLKTKDENERVDNSSNVVRKSWSCTRPGDFISPAGSTRYLLGDKAFFDVLSDFDPVLKLVHDEPSKSKADKTDESCDGKPTSLPVSPEQEVVLRVSLHCRGCERKMRKHISRMEGVKSFNIDFAAKKVTVIGDVTPLGVLASISKVKNAQLWPPTLSSSLSPLNFTTPEFDNYKGAAGA
ncbi:UDP-glucuronic acid decarboxylase 1 [Abeliophyllum distichum]|uniref:UDP-glucuronate decarboxylase n=1 Tax=Abeliophyllum distichum TaxID=126358 RepID=A0ABD1VAU2_9LAMI